jgi:hypothetical protein
METALEVMLKHFESTHQTVIEVDDFDPQIARTDVNVVISQGDITMIVRIGWGSLGLHADVYGYIDGEPVETEPVNMLNTTSVYVKA